MGRAYNLALSSHHVRFQDSLNDAGASFTFCHSVIPCLVELKSLKTARSKKQCLVTHRKVEQSRVAENHLCAQSVGAVIAILASLIPSLRLSPDPHDNWFTAITSNLLLLFLLFQLIHFLHLPLCLFCFSHPILKTLGQNCVRLIQLFRGN